MGINGLPGMILGLTIPRMFTSYIATTVQVTGIDVKKITLPQKGKKKDFATLREDLKRVLTCPGYLEQKFLRLVFSELFDFFYTLTALTGKNASCTGGKN